MKCKHDKVYQNEILCSNPPKQNWICKKCGEMGCDTIGVTIVDDYTKMKNKINNIKLNISIPTKIS